MGNAITIVILIGLIALAVYGTVHRIRYGSACCGSKSPAQRKIKAEDRNRANYSYEYILSVDGMHCVNCARRIENEFNKTAGRWATADIAKKEVSLLSKKEEDEKDLAATVASAGYTMLSCERK